MRQSVLLSTFFDPKNCLKRVLNPDLHVNLAEVTARNDTPNKTIVLQIRRLTDAEAIHLHLPAANFKGAESFEEVIKHDPTALAKLILFLA